MQREEERVLGSESCSISPGLLSTLVLVMQTPWCAWFFVDLAAAVESAVGQAPREWCLRHFVRRIGGPQVLARGKKQVLWKT